MVRNYGLIQNARYKGSDSSWTPEKVYLYKYDSGDPCGRAIGELNSERGKHFRFQPEVILN